MGQQIHNPSALTRPADEEYEYVIAPAAIETLINVLLKYGIDLRGSHYEALKDTVFFTSAELMDLHTLKEQRIIRSYTITKVVRNRQIIERG